MALIVSALMLGAWASEFSEAEALRKFHEARSPSPATWHSVLSARGWGEHPSEKVKSRVLRGLPAGADQARSVWVGRIAGEPSWLAAYQKETASEPVLLFCSNCKDPPETWHPLGSSWDGYDAALALLERSPRTSPKRSPERRDPREIRY